MGGKRKNRLRLGVGINDADYNTADCPYMRRWSAMLQRCYSESYHKRKPSYKGCYVCKEWLTFSNFKSWMEKQDWKDKQLDKDFLGDGKLYSPETCCFIPAKVNSYLAITKTDKSQTIGVTFQNDRYVSQFSDGGGNVIYKGSFSTPLEAHREWQVSKVILGAELSFICKDKRVLDKVKKVMTIILHDYLLKQETKRSVFL